MGKWLRMTLLSVLVLSFIMLAGCGNKGIYEEINSRKEEPAIIRIAWWGGEERHAVTQQVLELYSQIHPEITFEMLPFDWSEYFDILSTEAAQGSLPDLIQMDYQYIATYSENGSLADLMPFVEDGTIRTEGMEESILDSGIIDGRMTGIALSTSLFSVICNPEVFEEAGIPLPEAGWTWQDFTDICVRIKEETGKYGAAMTPVLDMNLYHHWVRQHGAELFSEDGRSLGYEDDSIYVDYMRMFGELMDVGAIPDSDTWAAISTAGQEKLPVVTGGCGMMPEWNNFPMRMSRANGNLKQITPPLADGGGGPGLWMKPSMFFSVAETSGLKKECAAFIDWFLNSEEANAILKGERGVPISREIRERLYEDETLPEEMREMFRFSDEAIPLCGDTPPPDPAGIGGINEAFEETANAYFYGFTTAEEAAAEFRDRVNGILGKAQNGKSR